MQLNDPGINQPAKTIFNCSIMSASQRLAFYLYSVVFCGRHPTTAELSLFSRQALILKRYFTPYLTVDFYDIMIGHCYI